MSIRGRSNMWSLCIFYGVWCQLALCFGYEIKWASDSILNDNSLLLVNILLQMTHAVSSIIKHSKCEISTKLIYWHVIWGHTLFKRGLSLKSPHLKGRVAIWIFRTLLRTTDIELIMNFTQELFVYSIISLSSQKLLGTTTVECKSLMILVVFLRWDFFTCHVLFI